MRNKIRKVYDNSLILNFNDSSKFVFLSDCHRSDGSHADNFVDNTNIYTVAMEQYYHKNFTYIELGDGDELWENKGFSYIAKTNEQIFEILCKFNEEGRLLFIYGNHDIVKKNEHWVQKNMSQIIIQHDESIRSFCPNIKVHEGIVLNQEYTNNKILLIHGHQVDPINSTFWRFSRFLVRYLWRPLEILGVQDPTSPINSHSRKMKIDKYLNDYANEENQILIAGHTHRTVFPRPGESLYFNDGCCVYPHFVTAIEIENSSISLVKWRVKTRDDGTLFVGKELLKGPVYIKDYF